MHLTSVRIAALQKMKDNSVKDDVEKREPCSVCGGVSHYSPTGNSVGLPKITMWPSNPTAAYVLGGDYVSKLKRHPTAILNTALCLIAKLWSHPKCLPVDKENGVHTRRMEYCSALENMMSFHLRECIEPGGHYIKGSKPGTETKFYPLSLRCGICNNLTA